jgi:hypothetical protein
LHGLLPFGLIEVVDIQRARLNAQFEHMFYVMGINGSAFLEQDFLGIRVKYIC